MPRSGRPRPGPPSSICMRAIPVTGRPDQTPEAFAPFLQVIKQRSDCVINLTTGGAPYMTIEERVRPAATFKPEVASLNMGSMNFGLFPMLNRFKEFKHDWERQASGEQPRPRLQEHLPGHRVHPAHLCRERHAVRVRVLRHQPPLQPRPLPRPRPGQAAAVRPDRVRHPGRHRPASRGRAAHEAHRRPAVRRPATAGRCWAPGATRCRSRRWRPPWAAMSGSGWRTACGTARAGWPRATPPRSSVRARSSKGSGWRSRPRPRRARSWRSRAATRSASRRQGKDDAADRAAGRCQERARRRPALGRAGAAALLDRQPRQADPALRCRRGATSSAGSVPEHIGSMCLREQGGAVVALRDGFHLLRLRDRRRRRTIADPERDQPAHAAQRRQGRPAGPLRRRLHGLRGEGPARRPLPARSRPDASRRLDERHHRQQRPVLQPGRRHALFRRQLDPLHLRLRLRHARPATVLSRKVFTELRAGRPARLPGRRHGRCRRLRLERRGLWRPAGPLRAGRHRRPAGRHAGRQHHQPHLRRGRPRHPLRHLDGAAVPAAGARQEREAGGLFAVHGLGVRGVPEPRFKG